MTKQDIIDYVMTTPKNTNKAVLSNMLDQLAEDGGGESNLAIYKVNIINNTNTRIRDIQASYGVGLNENDEPTEIIDLNLGVLANDSSEYGILVFLKAENPFGIIYFASSVNATCAGGVSPMEVPEGMEGNAFMVTGDGSITIS